MGNSTPTETRQRTIVATDRFSTVFGERRGSQAIQRLRDCEETCDWIRRELTPRMRLSPENLARFSEHFASDNAAIKTAIKTALLLNMCSSGLEHVSQTIAWPAVSFIPADTKTLLLEAATDYVRGGPGMPQAPKGHAAVFSKIAEGDFLVEKIFHYPTSRFPMHTGEYQEIVRAARDFYMEQVFTSGCLNLLSYVISQPDIFLPLYQPLLEVVEDFVIERATKSSLDSITHTLNGDLKASPARNVFLSRLRTLVEDKRGLSPMEAAVLAHPVWDEREFVTKEDVISRVEGDSLPSISRSAQRILHGLSGGKEQSGLRYITYCPKSVPGKKFSYCMSGLGSRVRQARKNAQ